MTAATAWINQRTQNKREVSIRELRKRETLYSEFIGECAKLIVDAFVHTLDRPETLLGVYALVNRIRLCATQPVLAEAEHLLQRITEQYFSRNLTVEEMRELTRTGEADPLKAFGEAARSELRSLRTHI